MDRYIGMDVHAMSCTLTIVGPSGRQLKSDVVETNGQALVEYLRAIPRPRHLCFEEGTQSAWLHEILSPHVDELVVVGITESRGAKSDAKDALGLAQALRLGAVACRPSAELLWQELDAQRELKRAAEKQLVAESHRHPITEILETCPGFGPIRTALAVPVIVTPNRFRTSRQLWSYSGLGIVMRSSADWVKRNDGWVRAETAKTRGLKFEGEHPWISWPRPRGGGPTNKLCPFGVTERSNGSQKPG